MGDPAMLALGGAAGPSGAIQLSGGMQSDVFLMLVGASAGLFLLAAAIYILRKRRRARFVEDLLAEQRAIEGGVRELFTGRKAAEIGSVAPDMGRPTTVLSEGRFVYTKGGEMLTFRPGPGPADDGVVASAMAAGRGPSGAATAGPAGAAAVAGPAGAGATGAGAVGAMGPASRGWRASYSVERLVAIHGIGVALLSVDPKGAIERGDRLDPALLVTIEELLEEAGAAPGEPAARTYRDRTVCVRRGGSVHLAAIVDGDPDERLDREQRCDIADFTDLVSGTPAQIASQGFRQVDLAALVNRLMRVFELTKGADPARGGAASEGGDLVVTSTVAMRHGLVELVVGIVNAGPGTAYEVQLLPSLSKDGVLEVVTSRGIEVDAQGRFMLPEVAPGGKCSVGFVFRPLRPEAVRIDCTVVYLRGVANVQEVRLPPSWLELEAIAPDPGEPVEPERVLELASQPAAFTDRASLFLPVGQDGGRVLASCVDALRHELRPVAQLEEPASGRSEAWFHGELAGGTTVAACLSVLSREGIVELFAASTASGAVHGSMLLLRRSAERGAGQRLVDALDPDLRSTVARAGFLLDGSWGELAR